MMESTSEQTEGAPEIASPKPRRALKKRGKIVRGLLVLTSVPLSVVQLVRGLWRNERRSKWLVPLAVFLCVTGILLVVAGTVEVLAPFIYTIF